MDNRRDLLDIGLLLFCQRGYEAVGIQELVDAVGVTKPTLYHYFQNKRGLLDAILEDGFQTFMPNVLSAVDYQHDIVLTLTRITEAYFSFADQVPRFFRFQLGLQYAPPESESYQAVSPFNKIQHEAVQQVFFQAESDHGNMRGRSALFTAGFLGMINTNAIQLINESIHPNNDLIYKTVHQFMHGIFS